MKLALIFGTRPEIIKLSPILRLLEKKRKKYFALHTGQHYSYEMDRLFFKDLNLPEPDYKLKLNRASGLHGEQTGQMLLAIEEILLKEKPNVVLVQGDTNSVLAGALAAAKIPGIQIGHVEAGLRSYDRRMPEELNRIVTDHLSDFLFTPTLKAKKILLGEGIAKQKIIITGNTIVDAVFANRALVQKKVSLGRILPTKQKDFFLLTLHRQENVDSRDAFSSILEALKKIHATYKLPIIFPAHPRTVKMLEKLNLKLPSGVVLMKPLGFLDFLKLEESAKLILTDSGGVQEEACILGVPCVTLRTTTERPETVGVGANEIAGTNPEKICSAAARMIQKKGQWKNPFGDGHASERILKAIGG